MKLIVCLDERGGMAFGGRRQSRDRVLTADIVRTVGDSPLYMTEYSAKLFEERLDSYIITDSPMADAENGAYCFVEREDPAPFAERISELTVYHWNRHYPSDLRFGMDTSGFALVSTEDFVGSSHEKITKEVWKK